MKLTTTIKNASRTALQWRLLLIWLGALLLPVLLAGVPLWDVLSNALDKSVHAPELAKELPLWAVTDLMSEIRRHGDAVHGAGLSALILTLLLSPFLTGAAITAARAHDTPRFRELFAGGVSEYPRMFRMLLWGLVLTAAAGALGGQLMDLAEKHADKAVLLSDAEPWNYAAMAAMLLLILFINATLDAGRAELAIDRRRTSAVKAWWRGLKLLWRRPGAVLGAYAIVTIAGLLLAALLGAARFNMAGANVVMLVLGFLVTQIIALILAWMRTTRLFALMTVSATNK